MISTLISILIVALVCYLVFWLLGQLALPDPIRMIVNVILVIIFIIALLRFIPVVL